MRTLLCLASAVALALSTPPPTAEACGGYGVQERAPQTFPVSTHFIPSGNGNGTHRGFVLLGGATPAGVAWKQLAPRSYDTTRIAPAPTTAATTFTLVGRYGSRVITSARYVYLSSTSAVSGALLAVEFPATERDHHAVAVLGTHQRATWSELAWRAATNADAEWLRARGFAAVDHKSVHRNDANGLDALTIFDDRTNAHITVLRRGTQEAARHPGWATGTLAVDGERYVVVKDESAARLVRL